MPSAVRLIAAAVLIVPLAGCESREPVYATTGQVRFPDGAPARFGVVEFRHETTGRIAHGVIAPDGRFALRTFAAADGATAGRHRVIIVQNLPPVPPGLAASEAAAHAAHEVRFVHPRFADYATSPLTVEVTADGKNHFPLEVEAFTPANAHGE